VNFNFSKYNLTGREKYLQRFFEILPGATSWTIIIGMLVLSFLEPLLAAVIIVAFYLYWLLKLFYLTFFLILSYFRLSIEKKTDWMKRVSALEHLDSYLAELKNKTLSSNLKDGLSAFLYRKTLLSLKKKDVSFPRVDDIYQLVIIPVVREGQEIVEPGI